MSLITELTKETIEEHNLLMINNLPSGVIMNILEYAKTISSVAESESEIESEDESEDDLVADIIYDGEFLNDEGWKEVGMSFESMRTKVKIADTDKWYILTFLPGQVIDPTVCIVDTLGNSQIQNGKTLIQCGSCFSRYVLLVDLGYDLDVYDCDEYNGYSFNSYYNPSYRPT